MSGLLANAEPRSQPAAARPVSRPHESHEREAERAADVVAGGGSVADWSFASLPVASRRAGDPELQRRCSGGGQPCGCEACRGNDELLAEPGARLDAASRGYMEARFGHDFSRVRVHAGERAAEAARAVHAGAFTVGNDIVAPTAPTVDSAPGRHLLAHELAHVVQGRDSDAGPTLHRQQVPGAAVPGPAAPARAKPRREQRLGVGRGGGRVDAELDRDHGVLTVTIKCRFYFQNTPKPWPSVARQNAWRANYIRAVTERWSGQHHLIPAPDGAAPAAECPGEPSLVDVRVQVLPVTANEHFVVRIGYTDEHRTSGVDQQFRIVTMDSLDLKQHPEVPQTPAEHEFGHVLGLEHISCVGNLPECYGKAGSKEAADIMGQGSFVSPRDYEVFADLMYAFTGCEWRVLQVATIRTSKAR